MSCPICQEGIHKATAIKECGHEFCFDCIVKWTAVSNVCPLDQCRFTALIKKYENTTVEKPVKHAENREKKWLEMEEEIGSESIHSSLEEDDSEGVDDEEEDDDENQDVYEEDFVVPDGVLIYADGEIIDSRSEYPDLYEKNPYLRGPKNQPDSKITTEDGQVITISWENPYSKSSKKKKDKQENADVVKNAEYYRVNYHPANIMAAEEDEEYEPSSMSVSSDDSEGEGDDSEGEEESSSSSIEERVKGKILYQQKKR